jgi:hypothetical protein
MGIPMLDTTLSYAENLVYVNKDYTSDTDNSSSDYLNLYVKGVDSKVDEVNATIGDSKCEVTYFNLEQSNVANDVYVLISVSSFNDSLLPDETTSRNDAIKALIKSLVKKQIPNTKVHFYKWTINSKEELDITDENDVDQYDYLVMNCSTNMCLIDLLQQVQDKNSLSKIVLISDGTNDGNSYKTSQDVINQLDSIPCEIIPVYVPVPNSKVTIQSGIVSDDISQYNLIDSTSFPLLVTDGNYDDIINRIYDWSNVGIFQVDLNSLEKDGSNQTLGLNFSDGSGSHNLEYSFNLPYTKAIIEPEPEVEETPSVKKYKYIVVGVLSLILVFMLVMAVITVKKSRVEVSPTGTNPQPKERPAKNVKLPDNFTLVLNDVVHSGKYFTISMYPNCRTIIGKSAQKCDLVIDYEVSVSRQHCKIFYEDGSVYIEDLNSSYFTYVNGQKVESKTKIYSGDTIRLGNLTLKVIFKLK